MGKFKRRREETSHKQIAAIWRGVGFVILVIFTIGGYILTDVALKSAWLHQLIPQTAAIAGPLPITINKSLPPLPGDILLRVMVTLFLDFLVYAIMVIVWAMVNPLQPDEPENPWQSQGRQ